MPHDPSGLGDRVAFFRLYKWEHDILRWRVAKWSEHTQDILASARRSRERTGAWMPGLHAHRETLDMSPHTPSLSFPLRKMDAFIPTLHRAVRISEGLDVKNSNAGPDI